MSLRITPGAILCYHGIFEADAPAAPFHVHTGQLDRDLGMLQSMGEVVPLTEILARIRTRRSTRGLVAITFDDAYEGVLRCGLPVLEAHGAAATVFAVSGAIPSGSAFWWDRLADLEARVAPPRWAEFVRSHRLTRPSILIGGHGRLSPGQDDALAAFEREEGYATHERSVNAMELAQLAIHPLIRIGPHSETHAAFEFLDDGAARRELTGSVMALDAFGCQVLPVFAAPYGLGTSRTLEVAREAGMDATLGVSPRTLAGASLNAPIPRFVMSRKRTGARLAAQLTGLQDAAKAFLGRAERDWASAG